MEPSEGRMISARPAAHGGGGDGEFLGEILAFAGEAPHGSTGGRAPFLAHAFAGVAAPAPHEGVAGKKAAVDFFKFAFVEPAFAAAINHVRVVEHEAGFVAVTEILEVVDFYAVAGLAVVEVVDELRGAVEPHKLDVKGVTHAGDEGGVVAVVLAAACDIRRAIDEPCDGLVGSGGFDLLDADARGADEVGPPVVMRLGFPFFPYPKRDAAADDDGFAGLHGFLGALRSQSGRGENDDE